VTLKNFYIVLLLLCSTIVCAQTFTIDGEIRDESETPVAFANILLLRAQDSTVVTGTVSNDNGAFQFKNVPVNSYMLKTSFIGFETHYETIDLKGNISLAPFTLVESAETLSEVSIVVNKPTLKKEADRLVFNVANTSLSEGTMIDVLRSTPSVLILDGAISVFNASPTVYINDRKVNLSSTEVVELLEGTSASNIKSVEVITNPSARYDADSGVVLNIVMSKNLITGFSGSVFTNYTQGIYPKTNIGLSGFFKSKKLSLFINYNYNDRKIGRVNNEEVYYPNEQYISDVDRTTWSKTHTVNFSLDYEFDPNNRLNLSSNMLFLPYFKYLTANNTVINPLTPFFQDNFSSFFSKNHSRDLKHNLGFNLDYEHTFKRDSSKLRLNTHFTTYDYRRKQNVNSDYFDLDDSFVASNAFKTRSDQATEIFTSQLDYSLPLNQSSVFDAGLKLGQVKTNSDIIQRDIINDQEIIDPNNTDGFEYKEDVYAGYLNYAYRGDKWDFNVGIRGEQTEVEGISMSIVEANSQSYLEWFPSASLSHKISEKVTLFVNYKRSIDRPDYSDLNPFQFFLNDNTIVTGNPDLQPVFIDYAETGIILNNNFTIQTYYKESKGNIFELPIQDNDLNVISYTPVNLSITKELGFDFLGNFDLLDRWSMFVITSFYYTKDEGTLNNTPIEKDIWANYSEMTHSVSFLKDNSLTADFVMTYISANIQGFQKVDTRILTELSLRKTLWKGKGILSLSISDLLNEHDFFVRTKFLDQNSSIASNLDNRYVRVGFRYKFGNTTLTPIEKELTKEERDRRDQRDRLDDN